ncbi:hypothetical protein BDA99DRAFT_559000 [Phascolomyces articulosus]|uniref:Uncharacterized protein n=1 Tax=Phascolomyces articulosus TaxID=60185 RepID=A0AAD5K1H1_9FUNG|nr:hypothetical protein BDA99DRAFT_559000 [Phascolomyces articulosus]
MPNSSSRNNNRCVAEEQLKAEHRADVDQYTVANSIASNNPPIQTACSANISKAIRHRNDALDVEGFKLDEGYKSPHNVGVRNNIVAYIEGQQQYNISRNSLLQKIYFHYDYKRSRARLSLIISNGKTCLVVKKTRRLNAFNSHKAQLEANYPGGEKLLEAAYMSDEVTDGEQMNFYIALMSTGGLGMVQVRGTDRVVALTSNQREKLNGWIVNADE